MSFPSRLLTKLNRKDTHFLPKFKLQSKIILILAIILSLRLLPQLVQSQAPDPYTNRVEYDHEAEKQGSESGSQEFFVSNALAKQVTTICDALSGSCPNMTEIVEKMKEQNLPYAPPINGGMIGMVNNLNGRLYAPPVSGVEYIASSVGNFIGKPIYAQNNGVGFAGLQSILPIWKGFRNVVYILASLILTFIGLLIMLRIKVSPQAVVTIQSALPQLVITLILVTFSYAIAGLLIDLSYLIQSVVLALLFTVTGKGLTDNLYTMGTIQQLAGASTFSSLSTADLGTIANTAVNLIPAVAIASISFIIGGIVGAIVGISGGPLAIVSGGLVGGSIGMILVLLLFLILILYWIVKLFFGLVKCYVTLIFKIIIGPLEIGMGAFPSSKLGFNSWITDVVANLAVFPITLLFMVIANLIVTNASAGLWAPNLLRASLVGDTVNGLASLSGGLVPVALGLGALMIMSRLPELIIQAVFMLKPSAWETAIGQATDMSRNPITRFAKGSAANYVSREILTAEDERRFPMIGRWLDRAAIRLSPTHPESIKEPIAKAIEGLGKS